MSKNMTRKGLAFGVGAALLTSTVAAVPAVAAVNDSAVSLTPYGGTQYSMVVDNFFDLQSTQSVAATAGSGDLKYLVTDSEEISLFDYQADTSVTSGDSINARMATVDYNDPTSDILTVAFDESEYLVTITNPQNDDIFEDLAVGDVVSIAGANSSSISSAITSTVVVSAVDANKDAFSFLTNIGGDGSGTDADFAAEDLSAGSFTEVAAIPFNIGRTGTGASDNLTIAYDESTSIATIANPQNNEIFASLAAGDIVSLSGINSASITTAFTGLVEVASVNANDDSFTFELDGFNGADNSGTDDDFSAQDLSAGTFQEVSDVNELDSYEIISTGALGAGVTALAAPTRDADGSYIVDTNANADATTTDLLRLVVTEAGSVTVQAWIDENDNDVIDGTEDASSVRTVTFVSWANSGAALNIETPVAGADWEVYVSFNDAINAAQLPATRLDVALGVLEDGGLEAAVSGTTASSTAFTAASTSLVWDSASHVEDYWGFVGEVDSDLDGSSETDFVAGYTYAGQIFLDGAAYGNIVYTNIGAPVADDLSAVAAVRGDNVMQSGTAVTVREEYTGSVSFKVLLTEDDATIAGNPTGAGAGKVAVPAGTEVTATVALGSGGLDADSTVTSGGKTLTNASTTAITYTAVTDANGYVTLTLSNDEGVIGDDLDVTVTHAGTAVSASVIWAAPVAANSVLSGATNVSAEMEDTWSIQYTAVDEFGAALAGSTYRVVATYYDEVGGTQKTTGVALDANGQGTLTVTDVSEANGNFAVVGTLQKLNTSAAYANFGSPEVVNSTVYVVADKTPAAVTVVETITTAGSGDPALELVAATNVDATGPNGVTAPAVSGTEYTTISGVVTTASGAAVRGTAVTVSAPGLFFKSGDVYTVGSATVVTSATGTYTVDVRSNIAGEHVVTATAGAATKTKSIGFDDALESTATSLVIDAPSNTPQGSSYTVTVSLQDAFGNPVETSTAAAFTLSYTGAGIALSVPSDTDSNGEASFAVLLGSNDTGNGVITASYDADATTTTVDNNTVVSKTVTVGATQKVNAGSFKGYVAVYAKGYQGHRLSAKVGKDWVIVPSIPAAANDLYRHVEFTGAGVDVAVRIYIDRVLIDTINLTTK